MDTNADGMRRLINLLESTATMDPGLAQYIRNYPQEVVDSEEAAMEKLRQEAEGGSRFAWGIARLPTGKYITAFPRHLQKWNLRIIRQGDQDDL